MAKLTYTDNARDDLKNTIPWQPTIARLNGQPLDATSIFTDLDIRYRYPNLFILQGGYFFDFFIILQSKITLVLWWIIAQKKLTL